MAPEPSCASSSVARRSSSAVVLCVSPVSTSSISLCRMVPRVALPAISMTGAAASTDSGSENTGMGSDGGASASCRLGRCH